MRRRPTSAASAAAWSSESFTPRSRQYCRVTGRPVFAWYASAAAMMSSSRCRRPTGSSAARVASSGACNEIARWTPRPESASRSIPAITPTVEIVT